MATCFYFSFWLQGSAHGDRGECWGFSIRVSAATLLLCSKNLCVEGEEGGAEKTQEGGSNFTPGWEENSQSPT